jgi:TrmH family RNA methyltransferase
LRQLRDKKHREAAGQFVVEGAKVVGELLAAGIAFTDLYATPAWFEQHGESFATSPSKPANDHPRLYAITEDEMARASHFPTPPSVLAVGPLRREALPKDALHDGLTLALDGVQDPGNVGTLLRLADWYALDRVLISADSADLFHQKVINASMGSFARVQTYTVDLAAALADVNVPVLGCDLTGDDVHHLPPLEHAVIVIGSEGRGLSESVTRCITRRVTIPRYGRAESLNAGIAAAIVCDNLRRIRS